MEGSKQMLEAKLQDAGLQLMECERQLSEALSGSGARSPAATTPGTPPGSAPRREFINSLLEDEVGVSNSVCIELNMARCLAEWLLLSCPWKRIKQETLVS